MIESKVFMEIKKLAKKRDIVISSHGYDELLDDDIFVKDVLMSLDKGVVIEDYPDFKKGECCLVLQEDRDKLPIHCVWGISKGTKRPAVLITAYRPDKDKWSKDFKRRVKSEK